MTPEIQAAAGTVWNYLRLDHPLAPADLIFVLGSHDLRVAEYAAELFHRGFAPRVALSGGLGRLTAGSWTLSEAEMFAGVMRSRGVPEEALLLEAHSTNTGENVQFTRELIRQRGLVAHSVIALQKPYAARRSFATIREQWPEVAVCVSSPPIEFADYGNESIPLDEVIHIMVGDLQRIMVYPHRGFMIPQDVPAIVRAAHAVLIRAGFKRHLLAA